MPPKQKSLRGAFAREKRMRKAQKLGLTLVYFERFCFSVFIPSTRTLSWEPLLIAGPPNTFYERKGHTMQARHGKEVTNWDI